jgi:hypothetical protein
MVCSRRRWCKLTVGEPGVALISLHRQPRWTRVELSRWVIEQRLVNSETIDIASQIDVGEQWLIRVDLIDERIWR